MLTNLGPPPERALGRLTPEPDAGELAGPIVVATDGTPAAVAAIQFAAHVARRRGVTPEVLTVLETTPYQLPGIAPEGLLSSLVPAPDLHARLEVVRRQLTDCGPEAAAWPIGVKLGGAAAEIAAGAREARAGLVVVGLTRHGHVDRVLGEETVLRVVRQTGSPLVAVAPDCTAPPRRVLVAVDFSRSSISAARAALAIAAPEARVYLAHVQPAVDYSPEDLEGAGVLHSQGIAGAFTALVRALEIPRGIRIVPVVLDGTTADELVSFAGQIHAELVAVGWHRHNLLSRLLLGSVATALLRRSPCSVLVTPPRPDGS